MYPFVRHPFCHNWRRNRPEQMAEDHNDNDSIFDEEGELMVSTNVDAARREGTIRAFQVVCQG